jgi:hypothetical protein
MLHGPGPAEEMKSQIKQKRIAGEPWFSTGQKP